MLTELEHVKKVMETLGVSTVVLSFPEKSAEHIYVDGKLVYGGHDSKEAAKHLPSGVEPHVTCNIDELITGEWECTSYDVGGAFPEYVVEEETL